VLLGRDGENSMINEESPSDGSPYKGIAGGSPFKSSSAT
jgi:hypothetical protein